MTELESRLAGHLPELQFTQDASSQSGILDVIKSWKLEDVWEDASKAVTERYRKFHSFMISYNEF